MPNEFQKPLRIFPYPPTLPLLKEKAKREKKNMIYMYMTGVVFTCQSVHAHVVV